LYASPVGAAGRVYLTSRTGATLVIKDSDKFEVLAENKLDDDFDASPAIVGKEMFLRGKRYLYCLAE
jgi:outer membrane protein assembly factor BamB